MMAAIQLAGLEAYNEGTWTRLAEDRLAFAQSRGNPLSESVWSETGQIFVKNGVHDRLSLYVAHRHFALNLGEAVVESGNVATPWPLQPASEAVRTTVAAKSWMFVDGKLDASHILDALATPDSRGTRSVSRLAFIDVRVDQVEDLSPG
ncbi:hypothetical protein B0T26DRAFT_756666 [Lasiosphaeria miniovina]|uniref:Uncharacterized protein n=1 Tax=Lasiosphaeria miniovina TaxID=1954250 RepID=A0AA39ZT28_9PEZI|nr:uncharacterized protein B0T26DRAFT_756666 [Lasiosphaeria miniovina]KAK0703093.1 hypothetical protein B0T26DRAFT_756666 [Lasiosphaeria miniovina]